MLTPWRSEGDSRLEEQAAANPASALLLSSMKKAARSHLTPVQLEMEQSVTSKCAVLFKVQGFQENATSAGDLSQGLLLSVSSDFLEHTVYYSTNIGCKKFPGISGFFGGFL